MKGLLGGGLMLFWKTKLIYFFIKVESFQVVVRAGSAILKVFYLFEPTALV